MSEQRTAHGRHDSMSEQRTSVVIVSHNTCELTLRCLESLLADATAPDLEVVLVDTASRDGTPAAVTACFPTVDVVALVENTGFARAANAGVARTTGRRIVLLNPDTVVHPGAVGALVAHATGDPGCGIVGGRTLRSDGSVDPSSCWGAPSLWSLAMFAFGASALFRHHPVLDPESLGHWPRDSVREVDVVTGCWMLVERHVWDELGGFDERFFMYGEDADLCLRARARGYRPSITPDATITHLVGASSPTSAAKRVLVMTGKATLVRKHGGTIGARIGIALLVMGVALRAAGARARRRHDDQWLHAWRARRAWTGGYDLPPDAIPVRPLSRSVHP